MLVGCKSGSYIAQAALKLVIWAKADLKLLRFLPPSPKLLNRDALVRLLQGNRWTVWKWREIIRLVHTRDWKVPKHRLQTRKASGCATVRLQPMPRDPIVPWGIWWFKLTLKGWRMGSVVSLRLCQEMELLGKEESFFSHPADSWSILAPSLLRVHPNLGHTFPPYIFLRIHHRHTREDPHPFFRDPSVMAFPGEMWTNVHLPQLEHGDRVKKPFYPSLAWWAVSFWVLLAHRWLNGSCSAPKWTELAHGLWCLLDSMKWPHMSHETSQDLAALLRFPSETWQTQVASKPERTVK